MSKGRHMKGLKAVLRHKHTQGTVTEVASSLWLEASVQARTSWHSSPAPTHLYLHFINQKETPESWEREWKTGTDSNTVVKTTWSLQRRAECLLWCEWLSVSWEQWIRMQWAHCLVMFTQAHTRAHTHTGTHVCTYTCMFEQRCGLTSLFLHWAQHSHSHTCFLYVASVTCSHLWFCLSAACRREWQQIYSCHLKDSRHLQSRDFPWRVRPCSPPPTPQSQALRLRAWSTPCHSAAPTP